MSRKVFKYRLQAHHGYITIKMFNNAESIKVGVQNNVPVLWAVVNEDFKLEDVTFKLVWTGEPMTKEKHTYVDTVTIGGLVLHIFKVPPGNYEEEDDDF